MGTRTTVSVAAEVQCRSPVLHDGLAPHLGRAESAQHPAETDGGVRVERCRRVLSPQHFRLQSGGQHGLRIGELQTGKGGEVQDAGGEAAGRHVPQGWFERRGAGDVAARHHASPDAASIRAPTTL